VPIERQSIDRPSRRHQHLKNSRSEDNSGYTPHIAEHDTFPAPVRQIGGTIYRSESSPSLQSQPLLQPLTYFPRPEDASNARLTAQYAVYQEARFSSPHDQHHPTDATSKVLNNVDSKRSCPTVRHPSQEYASTTASTLPTRTSRQESLVSSYVPPRSLTGSPTKTLYDVSEKDEHESAIHGYPLSSPKKRSRSPMKKMFGEYGWLGQSPDEKPEQYARNKKSSSFRHDNPIHRHQKKTSIIGKLKSKFEEFVCTLH
jgi:hypothetical protein